MFALGSIKALCFAHHHHRRRRRRRRRHRHCRHHHQQHYTDEDLQFEVFYTSKIWSI